MWAYLVITVVLALIIGIAWIMQPYFTWRKSQAQKKDQEGKIIVIDITAKTYTLS